MPKFTKQEVCDAMRRAAAKMEADPGKIGAGVLARGADGLMTSTGNADATCFCALGFLAKELNINTSWNREMCGIVDATFDRNYVGRRIFRANDDGYDHGDKLRGAREMLAVANEECPTDA